MRERVGWWEQVAVQIGFHSMVVCREEEKEECRVYFALRACLVIARGCVSEHTVQGARDTTPAPCRSVLFGKRPCLQRKQVYSG